ncbi:MAG: methylated-DNA--[protein]-cysteine S-methyltransferase [Alphaproteobacteria bacterium]|nr:methylated-DNA--[protein]-cysteine S-methyltransferase [Alphaproteobacteria bacterium]
MTVLYDILEGPLGPLLAAGDGAALQRLTLPEGDDPAAPAPGWRRAPDAFAGLRRALSAYFAGEARAFDIPLRPQGTTFQLTVWRALQDIPYGTTRSYGEIARAIGAPTASRAVGAANGRNPIPILIPCHRVIGAQGALTGFGGGLSRKAFLLRLEGATSEQPTLL